MAVSDLFNLKKQLVQYGSYHNNKANVAIHMIFVPTILWTVMVFFAKSGQVLAVPASAKWLKAVGPNAAFLATATITSYYAILDPIAAALYSPVLYGMLYTATQFQRTNPNANKIALAIHAISWIFQFLGHGVAEKRKPRLMDNFMQAMVSAPYFVWFELLFSLGYRPKLYKTVMSEVEQNVAAFRAEEAAKKSKSS
ncbi:DUF962-domain-containing protein [Hesseltinella vesiculosa]|uniref:DUF962-domain-containing protein n=1 Tax=Hesseltinella vesiculosa TaxID=101127 RepID=A0A1X2GM65_9FUNG|nr:DUF962-domain-containing protein [Hesseltinella vesiculosa]